MNGTNNNESSALISFQPVKVLLTEQEKKDNKEKKSSYRNLRNPNGSYFYTVEIVGQPNVWLPPEDVLSEDTALYLRYSEDKKLNDGLRQSADMLNRLKGLVNCGYISWKRQSKGKDSLPSVLNRWFKKARNPETPLPDFSRKYDMVLGVIKNK